MDQNTNKTVCNCGGNRCSTDNIKTCIDCDGQFCSNCIHNNIQVCCNCLNNFGDNSENFVEKYYKNFSKCCINKLLERYKIEAKKYEDAYKYTFDTLKSLKLAMEANRINFDINFLISGEIVKQKLDDGIFIQTKCICCDKNRVSCFKCKGCDEYKCICCVALINFVYKDDYYCHKCDIKNKGYIEENIKIPNCCLKYIIFNSNQS